jgi:hypothetical protein
VAKKSDNAFVVTARGERVPAKITKSNEDGTVDVEFVYQGGTVDVEFVYQGGTVLITKSPRDDDGKKPDSHHFGETETQQPPPQQ